MKKFLIRGLLLSSMAIFLFATPAFARPVAPPDDGGEIQPVLKSCQDFGDHYICSCVYGRFDFFGWVGCRVMMDSQQDGCVSGGGHWEWAGNYSGVCFN